MKLKQKYHNKNAFYGGVKASIY